MSRVGDMSRPRRAMFQRRVAAVERAVDRPGVFVGKTACGKQRRPKKEATPKIPPEHRTQLLGEE